MANASTTTDHAAIRRWVEEHGGRPAHVPETTEDGAPGILRIRFSAFGEEDGLEEISWDEFFDAFERNDLALLHGEGESRFNKLVPRAAHH